MHFETCYIHYHFFQKFFHLVFISSLSKNLGKKEKSLQLILYLTDFIICSVLGLRIFRFFVLLLLILFYILL